MTSLRKGYWELKFPQNNICRHPDTCHILECYTIFHGECSNTCINSLMFWAFESFNRKRKYIKGQHLIDGKQGIQLGHQKPLTFFRRLS